MTPAENKLRRQLRAVHLKQMRHQWALLDRCERKLARARAKLDAANRELKALRKLQPRGSKSKIVDGVFSVVDETLRIDHKGEQKR